MQRYSKQTVIIVHGTFAAPKPGERRWYQSAEKNCTEGFIAKLDAALADRGSPLRCWAHVEKGVDVFQWSGDNSWIARTGAAYSLADYVTSLQRDGWRCHIVAHSHGGNVVIDALPQICKRAQFDWTMLGRIVTLGTPFIHALPPIFAKSERSRRRVDLVLGGLLWGIILGVSAFFSLGSFLTVYRYAQNREDISDNEISDSDAVSLTWGKIKKTTGLELVLCIGSLKDEAWQLLHHLRNSKNPLATDKNFLSFILTSMVNQFFIRRGIARIHGARTYRDLVFGDRVILLLLHCVAIFFLILICARLFDGSLEGAGYPLLGIAGVHIPILALRKFRGGDIYSAFFSPVRLLWQGLDCLGGLAPSMITYLVRRVAWSVLQKTTMGLEGYSFKLPPIEQRPNSIPWSLSKYEDMPKVAEQHALTMRSNWVTRALGDISDALSSATLSAGDVSSLLRKIANDSSLVHAAYYTDDNCIGRIADWLAGNG
jgi:hypothetical protein